MNNFKCKNYHIIKIRYYASEYLLKKHYNDPDHNKKHLPTQHMDRAKRYTEFFWEFFYHVTGIEKRDWHFKYSLESRECAYDELQEKFGILQSDAECEVILLIPKEKEEIFEWIKSNVNLPYKIVSVLKHIPFSFLYDNNNTTRRQQSEEWTKEHIMPLLNKKEN